jgi:hypothetical protein
MLYLRVFGSEAPMIPAAARSGPTA